MPCETCLKLQKELYDARLVCAKQEAVLNVLRTKTGIVDERVSFSFLDETCSKHFNENVLRGGPRVYAAYVSDHVVPGRVVVNRSKKTARYVSGDGNVVEEPVVDFVEKVMKSTRVAAADAYAKSRTSIVGDFCSIDSESPQDLAQTFANMARVRGCDRDFCRDVAAVVVKNA